MLYGSSLWRRNFHRSEVFASFILGSVSIGWRRSIALHLWVWTPVPQEMSCLADFLHGALRGPGDLGRTTSHFGEYKLVGFCLRVCASSAIDRDRDWLADLGLVAEGTIRKVIHARVAHPFAAHSHDSCSMPTAPLKMMLAESWKALRF